MGEISDDTRFGIITHIDDRYNYVWNDKLGPLELRFPINPACKFELAEIVRYIQTFDARSVQVVHNLMQVRPEIQKHELVRSEKVKWKAKVPITFAPENSDVYRTVMANDDEQRVKAVAYSHDFKLLVSFVDGLDFEVGSVYMAWITRIPRIHDSVSKKIGTIFCIVGRTTLELANDQRQIKETIENIPWNANSPEDELGLPQNKGTGAKMAMTDTMRGTVNEQSNSSHFPPESDEQPFYNEEPMADNYIESLQRAVEGEDHLGVIVHCEPQYSAIWSPKFGLVRIQLETTQDPNFQPVWPRCLWVNFRCIDDFSMLCGDVKCNYTAYDVRKASNSPAHVKQFGNCIAAPMRLKRAVIHSQQFNIAYDDFFGPVLCCAMDKKVNDWMGDAEAEIEVYSIYTDIYKFSKWVAIIYKEEDSDRWNKIEQQPPSIDSLVDNFFEKFRPNPLNGPHRERFQSVASKYGAPDGWNGYSHVGDKIMDVLGVVVQHENDDGTTVFATMLGLARQPGKWLLGTWVRATIVAVDDGVQQPAMGIDRMEGLKSYRVVRSKKIHPPVSTRVFTDKGMERLMICCNIKWGGRCFENTYLGQVKDPNGLVQNDLQTAFLVEMCLSRMPSHRCIRFWKVLKNHGEYVQNVNSVVLKLSFHPSEMGRTCDDAHTVLMDNEYDEEKFHHRQQQQQKFSSNINPDQPCTSQQAARRTYNFLQGASKLSLQPKVVAPHPSGHINIIDQQIPIPTSNMRSSSTVAETMMSKCPDGDVLRNLERYIPGNIEPKRLNGLVVRKFPKFALVYTRQYGDVVVLTRYVKEDQQHFDNTFVLGRTIAMAFAQVQNPEGLELKWMGLPEFRVPQKQIAPVRLASGNQVQMHYSCKFHEGNIKLCTEGLEEAAGMHYFIEEEVGNVLVDPDMLQTNGLMGKKAQIWITNITKSHGCNWMMAAPDAGTGMLEDVVILDDETSQTQMPQPKTTGPAVGQSQQGIPRSSANDEVMDFIGLTVSHGHSSVSSVQMQRGQSFDDGTAQEESDESEYDFADPFCSSSEESFESNHNFDGAEPERIRIAGGSTPPPAPHPQFRQPPTFNKRQPPMQQQLAPQQQPIRMQQGSSFGGGQHAQSTNSSSYVNMAKQQQQQQPKEEEVDSLLLIDFGDDENENPADAQQQKQEEDIPDLIQF